ncbi:MAG: hypothetical protein JXR19_00265 [Bacteroidia bacterium]
MNKTLISILALTFLMLSSCKEDESMNPQNDITINFAEPVASTMYGQGDTVYINGMISADMEMHGYEISLVNTSNNNTEVFNKHAHEDGLMFHIHEMWVNDVNSHSDMVLTITIDKNHEGDKETKTILFHCHPM